MRSPNPEPGRVLVVDHDAVSRFLLRSWFQRWEVQCALFAEAHQALIHFNPSEYSLVILDYYLRGTTALEFAAQVREQTTQEQLPLPYFALHTSDDSVRSVARHNGFDYFLQKPLKAADLLHVLRASGCTPPPAEQSREIQTDAIEWRVSLH